MLTFPCRDGAVREEVGGQLWKQGSGGVWVAAPAADRAWRFVSRVLSRSAQGPGSTACEPDTNLG